VASSLWFSLWNLSTKLALFSVLPWLPPYFTVPLSSLMWLFSNSFNNLQYFKLLLKYGATKC
jgi:hypothetical protein